MAFLSAKNVRIAGVAAECGAKAVTEICDVSDVAALRELVDRVPALDGLVQCAGVGDNQTPLKFLTEEFVDKLIAVNLKAPILLLAMLEKKKKLNKGGSVVMMSSMSSFFATPAHSLYGATKGGLTAFVKGAVLEIDRIDFTINTTNRDIRKFHKVLLAKNTDVITQKQSSGGGIVTLEHWCYEKSAWVENKDYYEGLCS